MLTGELGVTLTTSSKGLYTTLADTTYTVNIMTSQTGRTALIAAETTAYLVLGITETTGATGIQGTKSLTIIGASPTGTVYTNIPTPVGEFTSSADSVTANSATLYGAIFN